MLRPVINSLLCNYNMLCSETSTFKLLSKTIKATNCPTLVFDKQCLAVVFFAPLLHQTVNINEEGKSLHEQEIILLDKHSIA